MCFDKSGLACYLYCTKSDWRCICHFLPALAYNWHSPPANGKQGPGKIHFSHYKIIGTPKNLKNGIVPRTNHTCHQKPNQSRETVPFIERTFPASFYSICQTKPEKAKRNESAPHRWIRPSYIIGH